MNLGTQKALEKSGVPWHKSTLGWKSNYGTSNCICCYILFVHQCFQCFILSHWKVKIDWMPKMTCTLPGQKQLYDLRFLIQAKQQQPSYWNLLLKRIKVKLYILLPLRRLYFSPPPLPLLLEAICAILFVQLAHFIFLEICQEFSA